MTPCLPRKIITKNSCFRQSNYFYEISVPAKFEKEKAFQNFKNGIIFLNENVIPFRLSNIVKS